MGGNGMLLTSTNGTTWEVERSITSKSLYGLATNGEQVVAVGREGVILRKNLRGVTAPVEITSFANAGLSSLFLISGAVDQRFVLEESDTVLGPWRNAKYLEITESIGTILLELPLDGAPMKFFRTRLL